MRHEIRVSPNEILIVGYVGMSQVVHIVAVTNIVWGPTYPHKGLIILSEDVSKYQYLVKNFFIIIILEQTKGRGWHTLQVIQCRQTGATCVLKLSKQYKHLGSILRDSIFNLIPILSLLMKPTVDHLLAKPECNA